MDIILVEWVIMGLYYNTCLIAVKTLYLEKRETK